jgi:hypothetical protein
MPWPTLIQLYESQYSYAYDGTEIRETWYVEPYSARIAFAAAMLGRVDIQGTAPKRTLPAYHFDHNYCMAIKCDQVPLDPEQVSYRGSFLTGQAGKNDDVLAAVQKSADPTADIQLAGFMSNENKKFSAGCFCQVTYHNVLLATANTTGIPTDADMDFLNRRLVKAERKNVPNAGLKLINPPNRINNFFGTSGIFYPSAGIAPEFKESYLQLQIERRMLNPDFDFTLLAQYQNCVDVGPVSDPSGRSYQAERLKFNDWESEWVEVPKVTAGGDPDGYSRWLNLKLIWDYRTMRSNVVCDQFGNFNTTKVVTWNHVLAYPGTLSWLAGGGGLAWYYCKFSANSIGVETPAFPYCTDVVQAGVKNILDPLNINP